MQKIALIERWGAILPLPPKILRIMRMTTFFLFAIMLHVSAKTASQTVTLQGRDVPLKKVFDQIYQQTGFVVFGNERLFEISVPVTVNVKNAPLSEVLTELFRTQPLTFSIDSKTIFLSPRKSTSTRIVLRGDSTIIPELKGAVQDASGLPLQGATVAVRNTKLMTVTDQQGSFLLQNVPSNGVLTISNVSYQTREIKLNGKNNLNITLQQEIKDLGEVEVSVNTGYQSLPRERATGSFSVVTSKQLAQVPVVSILERLQGMVPGVDISTKTTAGKSRNGAMQIRGLSTIKSQYTTTTKVSTDPLLVIDGFPSQMSISNGALDFLNPDDIDQITFLKDAAAASIWGIQAANGVVVIVTKKGSRNQRPSLSFSTTIGTSSKPTTNYGKMMSMPDYIALEKELIEKGRLNDPTLTTSGFLPENNSQAQAIIWKERRGEITEEQMNQQLAELGSYDNSKDLAKYMLQRPATQQYNLSLSGGGLNSSYFLSGYFYSDQRVYKSNVNRGYSLRAGANTSLLDNRITISTDISFGNTRDKVNNAAVRSMSIFAGGMRPYDRLVDEQGNPIHYDVILTPFMSRTLEQKGYLPFSYSPIEELNYSNNITNSNTITLNTSVTGKITPWLNAVVSGNLGRNFSDREEYWEPESYEARMLVNKATSINSSGAVVYGVPAGGRLNLDNSLGRSYNLRGQLNVNKNWNGKHQLNLLVGSEIRENFTKSSGELRYGYDKSINAFRTVNPTVQYKDINGSNQTIGATSRPVAEFTTRALSYYTNGSYTFDNKYTVSGSARFDDYNLLGVERRKRAIPLWSAGLKWDVGNENFLRNAKWIDRLSTRFTFGFSGNAPQGYAPVTTISLLGSHYLTNYPYAHIASPAVDNLAWEKTRMINYGIDFSLFKNRVYGTVEYYRKKTTDIIWQLPINGTYGFTQTLFNTANLDGKGFDIGINVVPVLTKDFKWTSTVNLSYNTNVVKDARFDKPTTSFSTENLYNGYPSDYMFSYIWAGLDNTGQSLIRDPKDKDKVYTVNEYPFENIRTYSGRTTSPWFGNFSNSINYKGLELNFQFLYTFGGVFRKPSIVSTGYTNNTYVGRSGDVAERWRKPGDEAFTNVPGLEFGAGTNWFQNLGRYTESDFLVRSRSNIRLQQIMLSYSVPAKILEKAGARSLTLSAVARNLGMIWAANKEKIDPDYIYTTGNNYQLPLLTSYSFRVALTF